MINHPNPTKSGKTKMSENRGDLAKTRVIEYLRTAIFDGKCGLSDVPELIKRVINEELWRERTLPKTGEIVVFKTFEEFLQTSPPQGLGTDYKMIQRLCAENLETLDLLELVKKKRTHGGNRKSESFKRNNVTFEISKRGNSVEYALKRLRKEKPDLHKQIIEGKLSVNQAMIAAGFRQKKVQITKDVHAVGRFIKANFSDAEIGEILELLSK
jgi:hypothetical protein